MKIEGTNGMIVGRAWKRCCCEGSREGRCRRGLASPGRESNIKQFWQAGGSCLIRFNFVHPALSDVEGSRSTSGWREMMRMSHLMFRLQFRMMCKWWQRQMCLIAKRQRCPYFWDRGGAPFFWGRDNNYYRSYSGDNYWGAYFVYSYWGAHYWWYGGYSSCWYVCQCSSWDICHCSCFDKPFVYI